MDWHWKVNELRKKRLFLFSLLFLSLGAAMFLDKTHLWNREASTIQRVSAKETQPGTTSTKKSAPDFTLKTLSGKKLSLHDFKGQYVLLNMWASWCGPCQQEAPDLVHIDRTFSDKKLKVLGINMTSQELSVKNVRHFVEKYRLSFPTLLDRHGVVMDRYKVVGIPTSYLIDQQGRVVRQFRGSITLPEIKQALASGS